MPRRASRPRIDPAASSRPAARTPCWDRQKVARRVAAPPVQSAVGSVAAWKHPAAGWAAAALAARPVLPAQALEPALPVQLPEPAQVPAAPRDAARASSRRAPIALPQVVRARFLAPPQASVAAPARWPSLPSRLLRAPGDPREPSHRARRLPSRQLPSVPSGRPSPRPATQFGAGGSRRLRQFLARTRGRHCPTAAHSHPGPGDPRPAAPSGWLPASLHRTSRSQSAAPMRRR